jgi:hypothetical protein
MTKRLYVSFGVLLFGTVLAVSQAQPEGRTVRVQVNYSGSGTVNATHKIFVALWNTPDFVKEGSGPPVEVKPVDSKSGTVTFSGVQKVPAYVSAAYDPAGNWDGQSGPPPSGTSLGMYSKTPGTPEPIDVAPGKTATVTLSFDDSVKMP